MAQSHIQSIWCDFLQKVNRSEYLVRLWPLDILFSVLTTLSYVGEEREIIISVWTRVHKDPRFTFELPTSNHRTSIRAKDE